MGSRLARLRVGPGVATEAVQNAEQAILEWIEEAERLGHKFPEPSHAATVQSWARAVLDYPKSPS